MPYKISCVKGKKQVVKEKQVADFIFKTEKKCEKREQIE